MIRLVRSCLFALLSLLLALPAGAGQKIPERLIYTLSWTGITVGTASQEISEDDGSRRILSSARSNAWLSAFFPVDDRTESVLDAENAFPGRPRSFRMLFREGGHVRDREILFDPGGKTALYHDRQSGERQTIRLEPDTWDIYSCFYAIRHQPLQPGRSFHVNVLDSPQPHRIEVRVLRREKIKVPAGEFDTIVIEPMVMPVGVFEGKKGVTIWLTDDHRRIPVMARTKVSVGSVTAVLAGGEY